MRPLEPLLGRSRFLTLYVLSVIGGSVGVALLSFGTPVIGASGATVNARARYLVRNNGYAAAAVESFAGNAVGVGIKPSSLVGDPALKATIQAAWLRWTDEADAEGACEPAWAFAPPPCEAPQRDDGSNGDVPQVKPRQETDCRADPQGRASQRR